MKIRTKIIIIIASILTAAVAVIVIIGIISIEYYSHPVYYSYLNENGIKSVKIDGFEYSMNKDLLPIAYNPTGGMVGFLDNKNQPIYKISGMQGSNYFIFVNPHKVQEGEFSLLECEIYVRSDFKYPEISADTINAITFDSSTTGDKDIIKELLDEIKNNQRVYIDTKNEIIFEFSYIDCYFKDVPGLTFVLNLDVRGDGSFVCHYYGMQGDEYIKISTDLLERIAGHKINVDEEIKSIKESEKNLGISND